MTRNVVVIGVTLNGQNSSCQQGIIEMLLNFICCKDRESDQATRILKEAKKIAVSMPGVESVAEGEERNILTVIGEEINPVRLVQLLEKKGCFAKLKTFGPNQTNPVPEPPAPAPAPVPVPVPTPPIFGHHSPHWQIVEIREPTSCFNF